MNFHIRQLLASLLLIVFVSGNANASTATLNSTLSFNAQGIAAYSHLITPGYTAFNDLFTFTTNSSSGGVSSISSFDGFNFSTAFSSVNLFDLTHGNTLVASGTVAQSFFSQLGFSGLNSNTTYGLNITGNLTDPNLGGFYSGSISVALVPEPSEYALLFIGLCFIAVAATRRTRSLEIASA